jgi:hypothetical protein
MERGHEALQRAEIIRRVLLNGPVAGEMAETASEGSASEV